MELDTDSPPPATTTKTDATREATSSVSRTVLACLGSGDIADASRALGAMGLQLHSAFGWSEALTLFRAAHPVAVLVDSSFLEGAGPQLCAALRRTTGRVETPVLAFCRGSRDIDRALEAGASDIVEKPLDWRIVSRRLDVMVRAFRASVELEGSRRNANEAHRLVAEAQRAFEALGRLDRLTGLPNRAHFERLLERALLRPGGTQGSLAALILDIDRLSEFNETLGRRGGDEILRGVAGRLAACLRRRPAVGAAPRVMAAARLGGDEFALVLTDSNNGGSAESFAEQVLTALRAPLEIDGRQIFLSATIGIAVATAGESDAAAFLQHAETALYAAKRRGGGRFYFYSERLAAEAETKLDMDRRLRQAFERGELELHYQPQLETATGRIQGVEALLRWRDPVLGFIAPSDFIGIAEDTGLMTSIGSWVLQTACTQLRAWLDEGLPPMRMAVNVSRCQLESGDFAAEVERTLAASGIDPRLLELELSERTTLRADPTIAARLRRIRALGVRLVVDNFGTGDSAVAHLRQFGLDALKIDRSFIKDVTREEGDSGLASAVTALAHRLQLSVVAEGVETEAELAKIRQYGCESVQGFLLARPCDAAGLRHRVTVRGDRLHLLQVSQLDERGSESAGSTAMEV